MVAAKEKGLILEILNSQKIKEDNSVQQEEKNWLGIQAFIQWIHSTKKTLRNPEWRLREKDEAFQNWWRKQGITTTFF